MSITSAMFTGVSGLLANAEGINVIGNNLANVNTIGFKTGRMLFSDMLSVGTVNSSQVGRGVQIQKVDNIFAQGSFEMTGDVTDVAIQGNSFFALKDPQDATAAGAFPMASATLTRAGAFRVDANRFLVNPDGYQVLDTNGAPIQFFDSATAPPTAGDFAKVTKIDGTGVITYVDKLGATYYYSASNTVGTPTTAAVPATSDRIAMVNPPNPGALEKLGGTLFRAGAGSGLTGNIALATNTANGTSEKIYSNSLEQSNVDMAGQFVKMILTQRAYSANSKTITTADEMTQEVLNLKR
jgi:flagellar hook protein FlgE